MKSKEHTRIDMSDLQIYPYCIVKNLNSKKVWCIGAQNRLTETTLVDWVFKQKEIKVKQKN